MNTNTNELTICMNCGCTDEELFTVTVDGKEMTLCADCLHDMGWEQCPDCGKWTEDPVSINDKSFFVCESCASRYYYQCDDCGQYFTDVNVRTDNYGNVVCGDCFDYHDYIICGDCGRIVDQWHNCYDASSGYSYCEDCYHDRQRSGRENYGYKPEPVFYARSSEHEQNKLYLGVELEVDDGDDYSDLCRDLNGLDAPIYMKYDGSLGDEGVEIVTHPCTLNYHQYELSWGGITNTCRSNGYKSHETTTCGLHVHVNRSFFGETAEEKRVGSGNLVLLANALWPELVTFSRRRPSALEDWAARPYIREWDAITSGAYDDDADALTEMACYTRERGRYQAINLENGETVEFRLFRGTLVRNTLIATLQMVSNMTRYAASHTPVECAHATWNEVMSVAQYDELDKYSADRGIKTA